MDFISMILLIVVLVAQIALFILYFLEKRYVNHRFSAMLQYIDRKVEDVCRLDDVNELLDYFRKQIDERFKNQSEEISTRIDSLVVSYDEAQQAANKVNDFASSLASIFDYEPLEAIKRGREKEAR